MAVIGSPRSGVGMQRAWCDGCVRTAVRPLDGHYGWLSVDVLSFVDDWAVQVAEEELAHKCHDGWFGSCELRHLLTCGRRVGRGSLEE